MLISFFQHSLRQEMVYHALCLAWNCMYLKMLYLTFPALKGFNPKSATFRQHYYPEGGWGWVIIFCATVVQVSLKISWTTCKFSWSRKWAGKKTNHYLFADDHSSCRLGVHDRTSTQLRNSLHSHSQSFRPRERNDLRWEPSLSFLLSPLFQSKSKGNTNGLISTWSSLEHLNIITLPCPAY